VSGRQSLIQSASCQQDVPKSSFFGGSARRQVINFKVEGSTYPNWTGTEQKRNVSAFMPDQFTWTLPASIGGTAKVDLEAAQIGRAI
jgi:hypothetical protein